MKVTLINIPLRPESNKSVFPIGIAYIATAIKNAGFELDILDLDRNRMAQNEFENAVKEIDSDAACMGCIVTGYKYVKKMCSTIKKYHKIPVIVGNSVASSIPEILLTKTKADIGISGEGDITIVELLNAIKFGTPLQDVKGIFFNDKGSIKFTGHRNQIENIDDLPMINYGLFDTQYYINKCRLIVAEPYPVPFEDIRAIPINTARGCPFNCGFCYHVFKGYNYRRRSIDNICKEIKLLKRKYGINYVQFHDELTLLNKQQALEFAEGIIKNNLGIFWTADCRAGLLDRNDLEAASKLKESGCVALGYSLESADEKILKKMNKHITVKQFEDLTWVLHKAGIRPTTSLVIGYPQETPKTLQKTFNVCRNCSIYPSAGYLLPQPKTPIYEYAKKIGKIRNEEKYLMKMGDRQNIRINLTKMSSMEMERIVKKNLKMISEKLQLNLDSKSLIKTDHYRQSKQEMLK